MARSCGVLLAWLTCSSIVAAAPPLRRDEAASLVLNGDGWTLLDQRTMNRQIFLQLEQQPYRLALGDRWAFAGDVLTGTQVPRHGTALGPWHGHAVADLFGAVYVAEGVEVNLNLTTYSLGASYGYRAETRVLPGIAAHVTGHLGPIQADLLGTDLGAVTVGRGLLFEQIDLEGVLGRLKWGELWLRLFIGGQLHSLQDDLFVSTLGYRGFTVNWLAWPQDNFTDTVHYLTVAGDVLRFGDTARLAIEGAVRVAEEQGDAAGAALARADWTPTWGLARLHLGYQARWYGAGISPRGDALWVPTSRPSMVWREDTYATNAFDAWWPSPYYHQVWHTAMVEGLVPLWGDWLFARAELEYQWRIYDDPHDPVRRLPALRGARDPVHWYPATYDRFWYRAGLEVQPNRGRPDRLRFWVLNKVAEVIADPEYPTVTRLGQRKLLVALELEIFL